MTTHADLDELITELTVDAYGDEEQLEGLLVGAEDALGAPEPATVVGVPVTVVAVSTGPDARRGLLATCDRDGRTYEISMADIAFAPASRLGRVAAAYRRWMGCA
jgi:hypothetical protein